jgi:hypothetical protein
MIEKGVIRWYTFSGSTISRAQGPAGFGARTVRFSASPLKSGDTPVIADSVSQAPAATLGVVRGDGTLVPLYTDDALKYVLAGRPDGRVAFSEYAPLKALKGVPAESDWQLMAASVYDAMPVKPVALGLGFSAAFAADGALIAIAPEGLVRIDSVSGGRNTLVVRPGMSYGVAAVSPDGTLAVLPNPVTHELDIFRLTAENSGIVSYSSSIPVDAQAVTFLDPHTFVAKVGATFTIYAVEGGSVVTKSTAIYKTP